MGITKDYFKKPIIVTVTLRESVSGDDGQVTQIETQTLFKLRRESQREANDFAIASVVGDKASALRLERLAALLVESPSGFDDFPEDERPLIDRVRNYFDGEDLEAFVKAVLMLYDYQVIPREIYG